MDMNQLEVLVPVAREKSFSRAAELLGWRQPLKMRKRMKFPIAAIESVNLNRRSCAGRKRVLLWKRIDDLAMLIRVSSA